MFGKIKEGEFRLGYTNNDYSTEIIRFKGKNHNLIPVEIKI
jgi:hypothetical protein